MHDPQCRFCLANAMLIDEPIARLSNFYLLGSIEPDRPAQSLVVPFRHVATPFELNSAEWSDLGNALHAAKSFLDPFCPSGWTIGWNVGAIAGQEVFHAHLHVIARFAAEPAVGRGIHALFRAP
ncbi:diadenosine tetraphosphate (Ap4A) HIT family hydrolase [Neorhizobium galegae]|uniref:HIT family protein n=1 Tax=Neorhizobium galegae TaxID=399 RepID=UPI002785BEE1|nr:HIT family protein [Neorhizobium galegae]MDQ0137429.1 diadenosine tetraphosphate (Ap4A) HIT family hydrolase [Neorhizobium galegae]